jgi:hypothetical protein
MWFSRIWLILLALAISIAIAATMLVGKPGQRQLKQLHQRNIDQVQLNTDLVLQLEARRWIDATGKMATDSALIQALQQTLRGPDEIKQTSDRVRQRLLSLRNRMAPKTQPALLIAVDSAGKQIARIGPGENRFRPGVDGLAGYPVVEDALRGFRRDDSWNIEGKLYLITASPVISPTLRRYVGALVVGREVNDVYAKALKAKIGSREPTDIAFYLRGKMVASTISSKSLHALPTRYAKLKKQIAKNGRSAPILLGDPENPHHLVVFASFPGEASLHNTFYAVVAKPPQVREPLAALQSVSRSDLSLNRFPWLLIGGVFLGLVVFGLLLITFEWGRPTRHLYDELRDVAGGLAARVDEVRYSGRLHGIARHMNEALLRNTRNTTNQGRDVNEVLGSEDSYLTRPALRLDEEEKTNDANLTHLDGVVEQAGEPMVVVDNAAKGNAFAASALPPAFENLDLEEAPTRDGNLAFATNPNIPLLSPIDLASTPRKPHAAAAGLKGNDVDDDDEGDTLALDPPLPPVDRTGATTAVPTDDDGKLPSGVEPMAILETPSIDDLLKPLSDDLAAADAEDGPTTLNAPGERPKSISGRVTSDSLAAVAAAAIKPTGSHPATATGDAAAGDDEPLLDEYLKQVFDEFVSTKEQCGESVKDLTFEKFAAKLLKNRATLIERFSCRRVRFSVYIKDGKAAIKATPVKE